MYTYFIYTYLYSSPVDRKDDRRGGGRGAGERGGRDRGRSGGKEDFTAANCFSTSRDSNIDIECLLRSLPSLVTVSKFFLRMLSYGPLRL